VARKTHHWQFRHTNISMEFFMKKSTALALSVASLFATVAAPAAHAAGDAKVHCSGINSCKGTSQCKTASSACAGQNSCKGHGWILSPSAAECTKAGGTVTQ